LWDNASLSLQTVLFGGGDPDYDVGPEAQAAAEQSDKEDDADDGGVHIEIFGDATTHTGNLAVGDTAHQSTIIFHDDKCFKCFALVSSGQFPFTVTART